MCVCTWDCKEHFGGKVLVNFFHFFGSFEADIDFVLFYDLKYLYYKSCNYRKDSLFPMFLLLSVCTHHLAETFCFPGATFHHLASVLRQ